MAMLDFNATYYLQQNPDVAFAISRGTISSAVEHFNNFGRFEGRDPNAYFDVTYYLTANPDVAAARVNPLQHFLTFGAKEGRFANAASDAAIDSDGNNLANEFDSAAYLAANTDVATNVGPGKAFATAYEHYILFGQFESRQGTPASGPFTNSGTTPNGGQTFTLGTGIDNLTGTSGDDVFVASVGASAQTSTLQPGDAINGGGGNDTLRVFATTAVNSVPQLTNVENVEFQSFNTGGSVLNLSNAASVKTVSLVNGNSSLQVTNAAALIDLAAANTTGGTLQATYNASTVAGTTDVQNVSLTNASNTVVTVNGVETINLVAEGTNGNRSGNVANPDNGVNAVQGDAITTVNVSGKGSVVLANAFAATTTTFNASANAGGVDAAFTAGGNVTATGGAGNDVFRFAAGLTTQDVVNGGQGFDTVRVTNGGDLSTAAEAGRFNSLTNIEKVAFDGVGTTVNGATFTNAAITNIEFNTVGNDVINNAGSARTYEFGAANTGDAQVNLNVGVTTLNVDLLGTNLPSVSNGAANTVELGVLDVNLGGVPAAGTVSTINLGSFGNFTPSTIDTTATTLGFSAGTFNSVTQIDAVRGSTVVIDGNAALDIGSSTNNVIINASAHTGGLVVQGSAILIADVGAAGGDATTNTTTGQTGVDTITLGGGRDIVQFNVNGLDSGIIQVTGGTDTVNSTNSGNVLVDVINGFTAGNAGDILDIAGTAATYTALSSAAQANINLLAGTVADAGANAATLLNAANLAADGNAAAGWTAFSFAGNTYALYENTADTTGGFVNADTLVQLAGVSVTDLTSANFG